MVTTGLLFGVGDVIAQSLFPHKTVHSETNEKGESQDVEVVSDYTLQRTTRAMIYGSFFFAPISVLWHGKTLPKIKNPFVSLMRRNRMKEHPESKKRLHFYDTVFRLTIDQLIFPAFVWIPLYNTVMITLAQHENPIELVKQKLRNNWWNVLKASWTVWPGFQLFNLYFIPVHLRIVCSNIWATGWNAFLSFVHNTKGHGKGSGKRLEELVDIEDDEQEITMIYD
ncbi:Protein SYM1 [Spathaspora sp. JA1]|nr:Protein SYM1 [Spathaspora sp. JA1]